MSAPLDEVGRVVHALQNPSTGLESHYSVRCGEQSVSVDIATDSDWDPTSVTIGCAYDLFARDVEGGYRSGGSLTAKRPLAITLVRETSADLAAKASGLSVEWQAGDPEFDAATYVHTPTTDPAVLSAVVNGTVRSATLELLSLGFDEIALDVDGKVTATIRAGVLKSAGIEARLRAAIEAFARLTSNLPAVTHSGRGHAAVPLRATTWVLGIVGAGGWLLNVGWAGMVAAASASLLGRSGTVSIGASVGCVVMGLLAGFGGASAYGALVGARTRTSSAFARASRRSGASPCWPSPWR